MTAFDLAVVPRSSWSYKLVLDTGTLAKLIKRMCAFVFFWISKFAAIIRLDRFGFVAEVSYGPFNKVNCTVTALFSVRIDKPLPGGFIYHCVLVEFIRHLANVTGAWDIFYVHLPLNPKRRRSVVLLRLSLLLGRRSFGRKAKGIVYSVKRARMPAIPLLRTKFAIHLTDRYMRIPAVKVFDPFKLGLSMSVGMGCDWSVRLIFKGVFGSIESLVPTHQ